MSQTAIPYVFMRGGTSRGPYFRRGDLPEERETLSKVLIAAIGGGHRLNIDGLGGGDAVTTKVAMLSKSDDEWADIDYFFAQVAVEKTLVDYTPTCGNILVGAGPAAIELGLVAAQEGTTPVKIRAINTGARVLSHVLTQDGAVVYDGDVEIAGVPGTAAPVSLSFLDVIGGTTGALLPTGNLQDEIDGVKVTCLDVAMPVVIARAADLGVSGYESAQELDDNRPFFDRMEGIRRKAGLMMGMGDVAQSVVPKFAVVAPPQQGGELAARYFMPWKTHPAMAITGAQCIAACGLIPGTVADGLCARPETSPVSYRIEHASGLLEVLIDFSQDEANGFSLHSAGLVRTARKLADGKVYIPSAIWDGLL